MPRKTRQESPTGIYHWITRGYLKRDIFYRKDDFEKFVALLKEYKQTYCLKIYHLCLMHNHVHLLVQAPSKGALSRFSHFVKRRYAYYYSKSYAHAGPSFEKRIIAVPVDSESYLLECGRYIERNPVRAGLAKNPADYPYSSYGWYIGLSSLEILTASPAFIGLSDDSQVRIRQYERYVSDSRPQEEFARALVPF